MSWQKECIAILKWHDEASSNDGTSYYLIAGPRAGSAPVVLAAQCPVKGEVKGWGVFPVSYDFSDAWNLQVFVQG